MAKYQGFHILCGCTCIRCGHPVNLEGYADADGTHYCAWNNDFVGTNEGKCREQTPEKIEKRADLIKKTGAVND